MPCSKSTYRIALTVWLGLALNGPSPAHALQPMIIGDDHGGVVSNRVREIRRLQATGRPVEIRGTHCFSSCTMFLALKALCVHPQTQFGFHGPTEFGKPLLPQQFEYWSTVIASHYPPALRRWYMQTARHSLTRHHYMSGADLARLFGIDLCTGPRVGLGKPNAIP